MLSVRGVTSVGLVGGSGKYVGILRTSCRTNNVSGSVDSQFTRVDA